MKSSDRIQVPLQGECGRERILRPHFESLYRCGILDCILRTARCPNVTACCIGLSRAGGPFASARLRWDHVLASSQPAAVMRVGPLSRDGSTGSPACETDVSQMDLSIVMPCYLEVGRGWWLHIQSVPVVAETGSLPLGRDHLHRWRPGTNLRPTWNILPHFCHSVAQSRGLGGAHLGVQVLGAQVVVAVRTDGLMAQIQHYGCCWRFLARHFGGHSF